MSFNDICFSKYIEAQKTDKSPTSGLGYLIASVVQRKYEEECESRKKIFWVTINPREGTTIHDFKTKIDKYFSKKTNVIYALEVRSISTGLHAHIMFEQQRQTYDRSQCQRDIFNSFKDMVGNKLHIDVRLYPVSYRKDKEDYLKGIKWDEEKSSAITATVEWREKNNLQPFYVI